MTKTKFLAALAALGLLATSAAALAQAAMPAQGTGAFLGRDRLRVPGCGRLAHPLSVDVTLDATGAWSIDAGAQEYTGSSTALRPRLLKLTPDAASLASLQSKLQTDASAVCSEAVTVSSLTTHAVLKLNKRETRGLLLLRARAMGTAASGKSGTGIYDIGARGPWTVPVP